MPDDGASAKLTADYRRRFDDRLFPYPVFPDEWIQTLDPLEVVFRPRDAMRNRHKLGISAG